jgi:hypothetical protein
MDILEAVQSAVLETGLAFGGANLLDVLIPKIDAADDKLSVITLRFALQVGANGILLGLLNHAGITKLPSKTGWTVFAVLFFAGQEKFLIRYKALGIAFENWLNSLFRKTVTTVPAESTA